MRQSHADFIEWPTTASVAEVRIFQRFIFPMFSDKEFRGIVRQTVDETYEQRFGNAQKGQPCSCRQTELMCTTADQ